MPSAQIALYDRPHDRRAVMRFQDAINRELDPDFVAPETNLSGDDYVDFIVDETQYIDGRHIEGKFAQTTLGRCVWEALMFLTDGFDDLQEAQEGQRIADQVQRIMENHPNNPYPGAVLVGLYSAEREWSDSAEERRLAHWLMAGSHSEQSAESLVDGR